MNTNADHQLDVSQLRLLPTQVSPAKSSKPPRHRLKERFLRGPIPFDWLTTAANLSERSAVLRTSLLLWFQAGLKKARSVTLSKELLDGWGLSRFAYYRAIEKLEAASLVTVNRQRGPGKKLEVTLQHPGEFAAVTAAA